MQSCAAGAFFEYFEYFVVSKSPGSPARSARSELRTQNPELWRSHFSLDTRYKKALDYLLLTGKSPRAFLLLDI